MSFDLTSYLNWIKIKLKQLKIEVSYRDLIQDLEFNKNMIQKLSLLNMFIQTCVYNN